MIYCDTNNNTHFIFEGEWNNSFNYSALNLVTEFNSMYALTDKQDKIITIEKTLPSTWSFLGFERVILLSGPVELMNEYTTFNYGYSDEPDYQKVSLTQINIEFVDIGFRIRETLRGLSTLLKNFQNSYDSSRYTDTNNNKVKLELKEIFEAIVNNDISSIYESLLSIKSQISNDKELINFIHTNIGPLTAKEYSAYKKIIFKKV